MNVDQQVQPGSIMNLMEHNVVQIRKIVPFDFCLWCFSFYFVELLWLIFKYSYPSFLTQSSHSLATDGWSTSYVVFLKLSEGVLFWIYVLVRHLFDLKVL